MPNQSYSPLAAKQPYFLCSDKAPALSLDCFIVPTPPIKNINVSSHQIRPMIVGFGVPKHNPQTQSRNALASFLAHFPHGR